MAGGGAMIAGRRARERQQGSVIIAVMVFMALLMLFATTLINHLLVSEADDVESLLAETRVYWAMNGHLNYMLSRAAAQGLCAGGVKKDPPGDNTTAPCGIENSGSGSYESGFSERNRDNRIGSLQDYLDGANEIQSGGSLNDPGFLTWYYPQNHNTGAIDAANPLNDANPYWFKIRGVVSKRVYADNSSENDGQVRLDLEATGSPNIPVLRHIGSRFGRLTFGFCVVDGSTSSSSTPPNQVTSPFTNCQTGVPQGTSRIQFIQRNLPFQFSTN